MLFVMAGFVPASKSFMPRCSKDVNARDKPGHHESGGLDCRDSTSALRMNRNLAGNPP
jgi:hypothetical protein